MTSPTARIHFLEGERILLARHLRTVATRHIARAAAAELAERQSDLLDQGLEETFPASDPVSIIHLS